MEGLSVLKHRLEKERPVAWRDFPDIGLYKDQVVTYLKRQLISLEDDGQLTPAMISNYIKDKILPKADGKKYNREHLAVLTEIGLLKQVLQVKDIGILLSSDAESGSREDFYNSFTMLLDESLKDISDKMKGLSEGAAESETLDAALKFAVDSYCAKLACERLIRLVDGNSKQKER